MTSILDVPEIRASVHRWTVADFRVLAEDQPGFEHAELIRGIIVEKEVKTLLQTNWSTSQPSICEVPHGVRGG